MNLFVSLVRLIRKHNLLECAYISRMKKRQVAKLNKDFDTKQQKKLAEEQRQDEKFFVNYNPLANSAFGAPGKLSEMPRIKWGVMREDSKWELDRTQRARSVSEVCLSC